MTATVPTAVAAEDSFPLLLPWPSLPLTEARETHRPFRESSTVLPGTGGDGGGGGAGGAGGAGFGGAGPGGTGPGGGGGGFGKGPGDGIGAVVFA